ncbi:MAG: AsnC family transcriptional regulator [Candidatus Nitrosocaldus sp.]
MPVNLDDLDRRLILLLMQDGRQSFRRLARSLGVSTPTAKARYDRLVRLGLIKRVSAIIDTSMLNSVNALLYIKASDVNTAVSRIKDMEEVNSIFLTSGDTNMVIRATLDDIASLEELMAKLSSILGLQIISSQIVTKIIKDEQIVPSSLANVKLECHYCKGRITGEPIVLEGRYYFCCTSCLKLFSSERHGNALES